MDLAHIEAILELMQRQGALSIETPELTIRLDPRRVTPLRLDIPRADPLPVVPPDATPEDTAKIMAKVQVEQARRSRVNPLLEHPSLWPSGSRPRLS